MTNIYELIDNQLKRNLELLTDGYINDNQYFELTKECLQTLNGDIDRTNIEHSSEEVRDS